jgi:hypothetical protein
MNMANQSIPEYVDIKPEWTKVVRDGKEVDLTKCCMHETAEDPKGCDCCYDEWNNDLKNKQKDYGKLLEEASQAQATLLFYKGRRDGLKKWLDDLNQLDEYALEICDQFELIISQVDKICCNAGHTVKAVEILFCMIRDFYSQIDKIKILHDSVMNCIKQLNSSVLAPGTGIVKCLEMYYEKLNAILKTKDDLIKQVMEAIKIANLVKQDVCSPFGLSFIFKEWQYILRCKADKNDCTDDKSEISCSELDNKCEIYPKLTFPIGMDKYREWVNTQYGLDEKAAKDAAEKSLIASKKKEEISASINSLNEAVSAVDPRERCK